MSGHSVRVLRVAGLALVVVALFVQSYQGRVNLVSELRQGCERVAHRNAAEVNARRIDRNANAAVSRAGGVPAAVKGIRARQVIAEDRVLATLDSQIDRGLWSLLISREDQLAVRDGVAGQRPFRCDEAFPSATPLELVR